MRVGRNALAAIGGIMTVEAQRLRPTLHTQRILGSFVNVLAEVAYMNGL